MKSVQITYDAKVKIGTSYERGEACTQLDFLDDKVVESLIADLNSVLKYNPDFDYHKKKEWTTTWINNFKGTVCISIGQNEQERWPAYIVRVVGKGIDKKTGGPIEFATLQTGL